MKLRMSENTFYKMCKAKEIKDTFKLNLGTIQINPAVPMLTVDQVNTYLRSVMLPVIQIDEDQFATLADGSTVNLIVDDRVVAQCADTVAIMKISDPCRDPAPSFWTGTRSSDWNRRARSVSNWSDDIPTPSSRI